MQTEGIHPETIESLGITRGDVAGDAFVETIFGEEAERGREAFFAMTALLGGRSENGRARNAIHKSAWRFRRG